jgi:predicted DNA-binding transcriptional regulator AlpA
MKVLFPDLPETFLVAAEVAHSVGCSRASVYRMAADGRLPLPVAVGGGRLAWRSDDVAEFLKVRGGVS